MESDSDECLYDTEEVEGGNILVILIINDKLYISKLVAGVRICHTLKSA